MRYLFMFAILCIPELVFALDPPAGLRFETYPMNGFETIGKKAYARQSVSKCVVQENGTLACSMLSIEQSSRDGECLVVAGKGWLELVRYQKDMAVWASTGGPTPLSGSLLTERLVVRPSKVSPGFDIKPPDFIDEWTYESTDTPTAPVADKKTIDPPSTIRQSSSTPSAPMNCQTRTLLNGVSP